jgi:ATP adenylyltransferase
MTEFPKDHVERLWAPWRVEYFSVKDRDPDFLLKAAGTSDDAAHFVVSRNRSAFLILNKYPYSAGHIMAVPMRKVRFLADLSDQEKLDLFALVDLAQVLLTRVVLAEGFNVGMNFGPCAGAGAPDHLHVHIVPRWPGDVNFMSVISATRVIPEGLQPLYEKLVNALLDAQNPEVNKG